jgi:uncharacterized integral membrane protein
VADQEAQPEGQPPEREGRSAKFWIVAALVLLVAIFVAQNSQKVSVDFIFSETKTPLIFALLLSTAVGVVIGWLLGRFRRRD